MSQIIRVSSKVYSRLESHVKGFDTPSGVIERLLDHYEGVETEELNQSEKGDSMKPMNRKQFVQSVGATCKNWFWSWSFVNEEERFVLFGAWENLEDPKKGLLILWKEWEVGANGRKSPGYKQGRDHLDLVDKEGYTLKTFKIIGTNGGSESAKITEIETHMTDRILKQIEDKWYAV